MGKFLQFLSGYVYLEVSGEQCERFLNLCRARGISIRNLTRSGHDSLQFVISVPHFFCLRPIRSKTDVHIRVLTKHGLPFFFLYSKKRKAFLIGILLCLCIMFLLSGKIWNIHVEGNLQNTTQEILDYLKEQGIVHGISKKQVNCSELAAAVRRKYPEITWVSARIEGTKLFLTIQEENLPDKSAKDEEELPCNLVSDLDGTIVKMITRSGIPVASQGDTCHKGDLLVLGKIDLLNDSQELIRNEYVHADADIYVEHELSYYKEFSMNYQIELSEGICKNNFFLRIGNWYFSSGKTRKDGWHRTVSETQLRITENFTLPAFIGIIQWKKIKTAEAVYTKEEAKAIAAEQLQNYEEKLLQKGLQISANNVKIEIDYDSCTTSGTLTVIEKTGKEVPIDMQEGSEERTAENG